MPHVPRPVDVLIVGSGLMGAAVARIVREGSPDARIHMVDGGVPIGSAPGQHLHDLNDEAVRRAYIEQASPGIQSLYLGAAVTPAVSTELRRVSPGMYHLSSFDEDAAGMPASAFAWNAGGMGVHWTAATPRPWGDEVFAFDGLDSWARDLGEAERLLGVHDAPFGLTNVGGRILDVLDTVFGPVSAAGRQPRTMPMAVAPGEGGRLPRTGPNRILPRMSAPNAEDFTLSTGTLAMALVHDGATVRGARVREVATGDEYEIEARVTIVAADPIRSPQLLFASGIRPDALGRNLNEHAFLTGQVIADLERLQVALDDIPDPGPDEWVAGSYWLPHSGPAQPFHGQIMDRLYVDETGARLAYSVGLALYVPTEINPENRLVFDDTHPDVAGLPRITVRFTHSEADLALIERARASQRAAGEALGDFSPERDSALLPPGSSLHYTGTARSGATDDGTSVCDPVGRVWGFSNLYLAGGATVPTAVVGNSTLTGMVTAVRAGRAVVGALNGEPVDGHGSLALNISR